MCLAGLLIWSGVVCGVFLWVVVRGLCAGWISLCVVCRVVLLVLLFIVLELAFLVSLCVGVCLYCKSGLFFFVLFLSVGKFGFGCRVDCLCSGVSGCLRFVWCLYVVFMVYDEVCVVLCGMCGSCVCGRWEYCV